MPQDKRNDAGDAQDGRRRGLEGKGFDAGTGNGGAGSDSAYARESSYGGQSSTAGSGASIPRGTDEHSDDDAGQRAGERTQDDDVAPRQVDPEGQLGASRREPGR
jgi:hypothetical protein